MDNMSMQNGMWRLGLRKARSHMRTAPGDALITAGSVMYHGPMDEAVRTQVLTDWLNRLVCMKYVQFFVKSLIL